MRISTRFSPLLLALALIATPLLAQAQDRQPLPEWDRLSEAQRQALVSTVRDRWNDEPEQRARMLHHAERWQQMTPEQRRRAHHGMKRWQHMSPEGREEARALHQRMRDLPQAERDALRERWKTMTPAQRRAWLEQNPPAG